MDDHRELISATLTADFVLNPANRTCYREFLHVSNEQQVFGGKKLNDVISKINSALNVGKSRLEGLCLLEQILQQCTTEVFTTHAMAWAKLLLQALQTHKTPTVAEKSCHVIGILLSQSEGFPEIYREMANSVLPPLVTTLIQDTSQQCTGAALRCLIQCITLFSGPCGNYRGKIEQLVVPLMDQADSPVVELACECYSWLPRCGGGGNQGIKHTEAWTLYSDKLLATMTTILDKLFRDLELTSHAVPGDPLPLPDPPMTQPIYTFSLARRYCMLADTLAKMLSHEFPAVVKLPAADIIHTVHRAAMKTPTFLMKVQTRERVHLSAVVPLIHKSSFTLLSALIVSCGSNLVPFADTINKIFTQSMGWSASQENTYGSTRPHGGLRIQVYSTMSLWLQVVGATVNLDQLANTLVEHGFKDAKPEIDVVKLQTRSSSSMEGAEAVYRQSSSKKRRKHGGGDMGQFTAHRKVDQMANRETCVAALQALRWLVLTCGPLLNQSHHKSLQMFAVPTLLEISQSTVGYPIPYRDEGCRKALYNLLLALTLNPSPKWPPPTQCTATLLSLGLNDVDQQVSSFCRESLVICQALIHPRTPSYTTPLRPSDLSGDPSGDQSHDPTQRQPRGQHQYPAWYSQMLENKLGANLGQPEATTLGQGQSEVMTPGHSGANGDKGSSSGESSEDEAGTTADIRVSTFRDNNSPLRGQQQGKGQPKVKGPQRDSGVSIETSERAVGVDPPPAVVQGLQEGLAGMEIGDSEVKDTDNVKVTGKVKDNVEGDGTLSDRKRKLSDSVMEEAGQPGTSERSEVSAHKVARTDNGPDNSDPAPSGKVTGTGSKVSGTEGGPDSAEPAGNGGQVSGTAENTQGDADGDMPPLDAMLASFVDAPPDD